MLFYTIQIVEFLVIKLLILFHFFLINLIILLEGIVNIIMLYNFRLVSFDLRTLLINEIVLFSQSILNKINNVLFIDILTSFAFYLFLSPLNILLSFHFIQKLLGISSILLPILFKLNCIYIPRLHINVICYFLLIFLFLFFIF